MSSTILPPKNSETPELDASIRATASLYWQDPEELAMWTPELLRLKKQPWPLPFYRSALLKRTGAHFLTGWYLAAPLQRIA